MVELSTVAIGLLVSLEFGYFVKAFVYGIGAKFFLSKVHPLKSSKIYGKHELMVEYCKCIYTHSHAYIYIFFFCLFIYLDYSTTSIFVRILSTNPCIAIFHFPLLVKKTVHING